MTSVSSAGHAEKSYSVELTNNFADVEWSSSDVSGNIIRGLAIVKCANLGRRWTPPNRILVTFLLRNRSSKVFMESLFVERALNKPRVSAIEIEAGVLSSFAKPGIGRIQRRWRLLGSTERMGPQGKL